MTDELFEILSAPNIIKHKIKRLNIKISDTRLMMLPSGIRYDVDKVLSSPSDPMLKFAERISEYEEEVQKLERMYLDKRDELTKLIETLSDDDMKDILYAKCIEDISLYKMPDYVNMSKSKIYTLYGKAINLLEREIVEGFGNKSVI